MPNRAQDLQAYPVTSIELVPVAAPSHPLARENRRLERGVFAEQVQLVLIDPENQAGQVIASSARVSAASLFWEGGWTA
jgi:hypothetical protein